MLGGSFNPAHVGHRQISIAALDALNLDGVIWLVTPGNPLKDQSLYADYDVRLRQAVEVSDHPKIHVSDFEQQENLRYSAQTIEAIQKLYRDVDFVWMLGADSFAHLHLWRDWEKIFHLIPIIVLNRPTYQEKALSAKAARKFSSFQQNRESLLQSNLPAWCFIEETQNPISSTQIRAKQTKTNQAKTNQEKAPQTLAVKKTRNSNDQHSANSVSRQQAMRVLGDKDFDKKDSIIMDQKTPEGLTHFLDLNPSLGDFKTDLLEGLSKPQKQLSPKYFYDETGSQLFFDITQTKDYYPTRTELSLMRKNMPQIKAAIGPEVAIFEYGSGASEKIKLLLQSLENVKTYVAMDISRDYLLESAQTIAREYPDLSVSAVCADFNHPIEFPVSFHGEVKKWTGYFPGSTIGNFPAGAATQFLTRASDSLGSDAQFLLGFDLIKDEKILNAAYNDGEGVTAAFNLNLLKRMQTELGAKVTLDDFVHDAFYNRAEGRIEMHLRAIKNTEIVIPQKGGAIGKAGMSDGEKQFSFAAGESLHTEFSYKYTREIMEEMVARTPWRMSHFWTDENNWFALCLLCNK